MACKKCKDKKKVVTMNEAVSLTMKKNVKEYPMPVPSALRSAIPLRNRTNSGAMFMRKGETVTVDSKLGTYLKEKYGQNFLKE